MQRIREREIVRLPRIPGARSAGPMQEPPSYEASRVSAQAGDVRVAFEQWCRDARGELPPPSSPPYPAAASGRAFGGFPPSPLDCRLMLAPLPSPLVGACSLPGLTAFVAMQARAARIKARV